MSYEIGVTVASVTQINNIECTRVSVRIAKRDNVSPSVTLWAVSYLNSHGRPFTAMPGVVDSFAAKVPVSRQFCFHVMVLTVETDSILLVRCSI